MTEITVFFDIGGTLIDCPDIFEVITKKLVNRWPDQQTYDLALKTYEGMFNNMRSDHTGCPFNTVGESYAMALAFLARQYGYRDISDEACDIAVDTYGRQSNLFPETKPTLEKLLKNNVRMVIASDNDLEILEVQMLKHDLAKYFAHYCISETIRAYKPTAGFVANLKKYVPNDPSDCLFVGDMPFDVKSGERLGVKSVVVDRKNAGKEVSADFVIHDLSQLLPILGLG
jgi:FMN phosphatase YigB (HAD superfamily)